MAVFLVVVASCPCFCPSSSSLSESSSYRLRRRRTARLRSSRSLTTNDAMGLPVTEGGEKGRERVDEEG